MGSVTEMKHILIISLDGASWNVLQPLIERGDLPHLAAMAAGGASGVMQSTYPPLTPPAWTSFQTGVQPPRHGVWAFTEVADDGWPSPNVVSSESIRCKTLWEYLGEHQRRVVLVDVPLTYPFRPILGRAVSDVFVPYNSPKHNTWTYPPELGQEIDHLVGGWQFIKGPELRGQADDASIARFLHLMHEFVRQREVAALHLLAAPDWDVAMVHIHAVDVLQHAVWGWLIPEHPLFRPDRYAQVADFYRRVDTAVGRIAAAAPPDTLVLVLSDHGFRSHRKVLNLNAWLHRQGWLKLPRLQALRRTVSRSPSLTRGARLLLRLHVPKAPILLGYRSRFWMDRARSLAASTAGPWQTQYGLISLNRRLSPARRARLIEEITAGLRELRDAETGERVVAEVRTIAEVYGAECVGYNGYSAGGEQSGANCPDLVAIPAEGYSIDPGTADDEVLRPVTSESFHIGTHAFEGVWFLDGPDVAPAQGGLVPIVDFAPTLLFYLGLPVPGYMQGRVRTDLFAPQFLHARPPVFVDDDGIAGRGDSQGEGYGAAEQAMVEERLRNLGYL